MYETISNMAIIKGEEASAMTSCFQIHSVYNKWNMSQLNQYIISFACLSYIECKHYEYIYWLMQDVTLAFKSCVFILP